MTRSDGLFSCLYDDRGGQIFLGILTALAVVVPLLHLVIPAGSPLHIPTWVVSLLGKYLCYALLALSVDLIWGFCGILSLGHGAFFALGGYAMGMYLMRQIGDRGVYAHPELPDFMVFLNWQELPWYWYGFDSFAFAVLMIFVVPGALGFLFGWLTFRSRVTGVYLSIISQAMILLGITLVSSASPTLVSRAAHNSVISRCTTYPPAAAVRAATRHPATRPGRRNATVAARTRPRPAGRSDVLRLAPAPPGCLHYRRR